MAYDNWEDFYEELVDFWNGQSETYDSYTYDEIVSILNSNPTAEHAQEGLDGLIQACIDGCRYSADENEILTFAPIIDQMVEMGATVDADFLKPEYDGIEDFDTEMANWIVVKAMLLKITERYIDVPAEFTNATPIYWEKMVKKGNLDEKYTYNEAYYNALKETYNSL
jgi:hypothetical protein